MIALTPLLNEDSGTLFEWINDREEVLHSAPYSVVHEADHEAWFDSIRNRDDVVIFAIRERDSERLIGSCQLLNIDPRHGSCELQIRIGEVAARGQGHGTEAVRLLLDHAFRDLGLHRVGLHVFSGNEAAISAYEKAGFVREGLMREAAMIDGDRVDVVVMAIIGRDYAAAQ